MTNPAMTIRVAANLDELRRNLTESRGLIEVTTQGLTKLAASLRGDKLVQQAHNIVAAIDQIGGTTKLTVQEAQRLEPTLAKAIAKLELMGKTVPTALRQTHDALKSVTDQSERTASSFGSIVGKAQSLLAVFGVGMGIGALTAFGRSVLSAGERISDLSKKMSVSAEAAQRLQWAARESGADLEDVSRAVLLMSENLASGDRAAAAAIATLQLSFTHLRASTPEAAFRQITEAIGRVPDAMKQAELSVQVFGRSGRELLGMIREGTLQAADALTVFTNKEIEERARAKSVWENYGNWLTVYFSRLLEVGGKRFIPGLALDAYAQEEAARQKAGALPAVSRPAGLQPSLVPTTPGAGATWEEMDRVLTRMHQQRQEAAEAIARAAAALKAEAWAGAVQAVEARMARVVTVLEKMAAEKWSLSTAALKSYVTEIDTWLKAGYRVPDVLEQMWRGNLDLVDSIKAITVAVPSAISALTQLGQKGREWLTLRVGTIQDFFSQISPVTPGWGGLLGPAPDSRFDAERAAQRTAMYASLLDTVSVAMRNLGTQGSTAWKFVTAGIETATTSLQAYLVEQDATKKASAAMASATQGAISVMISGVLKIFSLFKEQREKNKQFAYDWQQVLRELQMPQIQPAAFVNSAEWQRIRDQFQQTWAAANPGPMGESSWQQMFRYFRDRLTQLKDTVADLGRALQGVGGFVPPSLQPLLDDLLQSTSLTDAMRQQLEGLAREPSWQYMQERAEALGVSLEGLGGRFQQAKIKDIALGYVRDLAMFEQGAADMTVVLDGMKDELSAVAQQALKSGSLLPATLKPYLQRLAEIGALLDENGNKIDLGALSFREMEDETLTAIKTLLQQIRDLLAGLPAVAGRAGQALKDLVVTPPARTPVDAIDGYGYIAAAPARAAFQAGPALAAGAWGPTPVAITIQAWDGASVDRWLDQGGDRRLAQAVANVSRELGYA